MQATSSALVAACLLHGFLLDTEDGRSTLLQNVSDLLPYYTILHLRRQYFTVTAVRTSNITRKKDVYL
jgi:Mg2+/citrate symporter